MISFAIVFRDENHTEKHISFEAHSVEEAFQIIERERIPGDVTLWEGDKRLGNICLIKPGLWQLHA